MHQVHIPEGALLRRINRRLYRDDFQVVKRCREASRAFSALGRFYILDYDLNFVIATDIDLDTLAREVGVLRPGESLGEGA